MNKRATVYTNDRKKPQITLTVSGPVEKFADIHPARVSLYGKVGQTLRSQVVIRPRSDLPFKILEVSTRTGTHIRHRLDTYERDGRTGYRLLVENTKTDKGRYVDTLTLTTDSRLRPRITIPVIGNITDAGEGKRTP